MQDEQKDHQAQIRVFWETLLVEANAKRWDAADRIFNEMRGYAKSQDMAFMDLHVHYARNLIDQREYERSFPHLKFLRDIYIQVGITDYSFLGLRGIPPFANYLSIVKDYIAHQPGIAQIDLLEKLIDAVDDEGKSAIQKTLKSLQTAGRAV